MGGCVEDAKGARDLSSLVLHQGEAQPLQRGASELPEVKNCCLEDGSRKSRIVMLGIPVSLNGVGGDGNKAAIVALEGRGKRAEEAGRHRQEIALSNKL